MSIRCSNEYGERSEPASSRPDHKEMIAGAVRPRMQCVYRTWGVQRRATVGP